MPRPLGSNHWVAKKSSEYSPILAASSRTGHGVSSRSSHSAPAGLITSAANSCTQSRISRRSALSSRENAAPESGPGSQGFSLELGEDLARTRDWLHEFAASVIRPAGAEWDEREETPWPVLEEAAKIGLYSLDFYTQQYLEPSGLGIPVVFEELFWGDAGIGMSLAGSTLAALSVAANGTPEQVGEWCPQMFGGPGDVKLGAFCSSEPEAGSDVAAIRTRAVYDATAGEWVLNGVKTWATNGGIAEVHVVVASVDPSLGSRGQASFVVPPGTAGLSMGQKFRKHGIRASHTAEVVLSDVRVPERCVLGGRERLEERLARIREGGHAGEQAAMRTFEASRPGVAEKILKN